MLTCWVSLTLYPTYKLKSVYQTPSNLETTTNNRALKKPVKNRRNLSQSLAQVHNQQPPEANKTPIIHRVLSVHPIKLPKSRTSHPVISNENPILSKMRVVSCFVRFKTLITVFIIFSVRQSSFVAQVITHDSFLRPCIPAMLRRYLSTMIIHFYFCSCVTPQILSTIQIRRIV